MASLGQILVGNKVLNDVSLCVGAQVEVQTLQEGIYIVGRRLF